MNERFQYASANAGRKRRIHGLQPAIIARTTGSRVTKLQWRSAVRGKV
jgi:hypothetical protein